MKKLAVLFACSILFLSCSSENKNIKESNQKQSTSNGENNIVSGEYYYSNEVEKNDLMEQISIEFLAKTYESEFDSRYQITGYVMADFPDENKLIVNSAVVNIGGLSSEELPYFIMTNPVEYTEEVLAAGSNNPFHTEKLEHYCESGSRGGASITLNRPIVPSIAARYGKQVAEFAQACLNGVGCVSICTAFVEVGPNAGYLRFESIEQGLEYSELLGISSEILFKQLNTFN